MQVVSNGIDFIKMVAFRIYFLPPRAVVKYSFTTELL